MKKFQFIELKKFLEKNNQPISATIDEKEIFNGINSLSLSSKYEITFFHNSRYQNLLSSTKAKACFINDSNKKFLPTTCYPIIVEDPYLAFAYTTHLFSDLNQSTGIIDKTSSIHKDTIISESLITSSRIKRFIFMILL